VRDDRVVDRLLHQQRNRDRDQRVREREREADRAQAPLGSPEPEQPAEGRQQAEVGWVDGVRAFRHDE
jgi:chromatin segregation and condensation protein Rec8/ScpA/Scc1 (kleisin family)